MQQRHTRGKYAIQYIAYKKSTPVQDQVGYKTFANRLRKRTQRSKKINCINGVGFKTEVNEFVPPIDSMYLYVFYIIIILSILYIAIY